MATRLDDKTALITGANSGIALVTSDSEVAARLWRIGADLVVPSGTAQRTPRQPAIEISQRSAE